MKRLITLLLALTMLIPLCACGVSNIEDFCEGYSIRWDGIQSNRDDTQCFYALFEDGVLTIERKTPIPSSTSPTGAIWITSESGQFPYELQGNDTVIIDGETYKYEFYDDIVKFDKPLLDIDYWWSR